MSRVHPPLTMPEARLPVFTPTYRRPNNPCGTVLYGIAPGSVLYLTVEMAARAAVGAFEAASAVAGQAAAALVVGSRVAFTTQNGRA